jgi:hypothetical protein
MKKRHEEKFSAPVGNYPPAGCQGPVVGVYDEEPLSETRQHKNFLTAFAKVKAIFSSKRQCS